MGPNQPGSNRKVVAAWLDLVRRSSLGTLIDYYVTFSGEGLDGAIKGYREVTGVAPLYAKFAYGFWQCKEHYSHQDEMLANAIS